MILIGSNNLSIIPFKRVGLGVKGSKASRMSFELLSIMIMLALFYLLCKKSNLLWFLCKHSFIEHCSKWGCLGDMTVQMNWEILVATSKLTWLLAWEMLRTIENKYLSWKSKLSSLMLWLDSMPVKFHNATLRQTKKHMVLSDFILCPVFQ